ncbi:MAG: hypothetical protein D6762_07800, partial [Candidatus Neomarinimicrobiota bacterium]
MSLNSGYRVALVGNPNSGKTALFNQLTGLNQKVSNYPGITVEKKTGRGLFPGGESFQVMDLPGTYSLVPDSLDEQIVADQFLAWSLGSDPPDVLVAVVDTSNLRRNLLLVTQCLELGLPVVLALNMMDRVRRKVTADQVEHLRRALGAAGAVPVVAVKGEGLDQLLAVVEETVRKRPRPTPLYFGLKKPVWEDLVHFGTSALGWSPVWSQALAVRLVGKEDFLSGIVIPHLADRDPAEVDRLRSTLASVRDQVPNWRSILAGDARHRYEQIDRILAETGWSEAQPHLVRSRSERIDAV